MQLLTLLLAIALSIPIVLGSPVAALSAFCAGLFAYPQNLTVRLGVADFTLGRILILVLLARVFLRDGSHRRFAWTRLDVAVGAAFLGQCIATLFTTPAAKAIETQGGAFLDVVLPYVATRLIVTNPSGLIRFLKHLVLLGAVLGVLGVFESVTYRNPYGPLMAYDAWGLKFRTDLSPFIRHGFLRAGGPFANSIGFGLFFTCLAAISVGLLRLPGFRLVPWGFVSVALFGGCVSSWSSGPLCSLIFTCAMIAGFPLRRFWRPLAVFVVISCVFLEFYSNRHFYEIPTRIAFNEETAYYRIGLYEEALGGGMSGHWLAGFGYVGINPNSEEVNVAAGFDWVHRDFTSVYIDLLAQFGLLGLVPFLVLTVLYYRRLYVASFCIGGREDAWFLWCFAAGLFGWTMATFTVTLVAQTRGLFFLLLGVAANMPPILREANSPPEGGEE
ncbi:hypothetical protein JW916_04940 [Candidatus Sumerlaeota bacterium]|nr:hypothetical protein [Candidatus Sumerlaeota bacterium]